jgi:Rps23 Pro-64 3,4-dihydroxylase Tpa1-like proline 4-hydroxylase
MRDTTTQAQDPGSGRAGAASRESPDRRLMGKTIEGRLIEAKADLVRQWSATAPINHFVVDDVLPEAWVREIRGAFPSAESMTLKRSLRELKFVAAQMNKYNPLLEEVIYAFQVPGVVARVEEITGLAALEPDELLYAGGISLMAPGHFLNPHVDNSHDKFRQRYRVLNLLYYVSPGWSADHGANLELWPDGPRGTPVTVVSKFNRLVVMVTHAGSWHSVSRNIAAEDRCCVSNYYFSQQPVGGKDYFHVTSFRGRPEQPVRDAVLRLDIGLRMMLRRIFPHGVRENPHFYRKKQ